MSGRYYVPRFNAMPDDEVRGFVAEVGTAQLVTVAADGAPHATFLPVLWRGDRLVGHLARSNPHWRGIADGSSGLAVVQGPDAYVSPSFYASKREHGRVVPTWNYSAVQLRGPVRVVDDVDWLRELVGALTDRHEAGRDVPWAVEDAPERYVAAQLKAIVGVEMVVESVEAKAKLSQNRSEDDRAGVVAGLAGGPGEAVADAMRRSDARGASVRELKLLVVESDRVDEATRLALRRLWDRAFADRFTADDEGHAYGGVHVLALDGELVVGHASAVPRRIRFGDGEWLEVGYVEAVATEPERQGAGVGRRVMVRLQEQIAARWPVAMLSTGRATGFYERLGWERWGGLSYTRTANGDVPDDEHGGLMILRVDPAAVPDLTVAVTCEDRPGDAW